MIGPPPSFYDPNQAIVPEGPDYQQWIMANYGTGSGTQFGYGQGQTAGNVPFQPQSQLHHVPAPAPAPAPTPTQNQYNFVQEQYGPESGSSYDSHLVRQQQQQQQQHAAADRPQRGLPGTRISRRGGGGAAVTYPPAPQLRMPGQPFSQSQQQSPPHGQSSFIQSPASNDGYFYSGSAGDAPQAPPPQQQHSSYNFVGYQPDQYASSTTYTPSSEFTNLPSSVSTPSVGGTDDGHGQTHAYPPLASQHGPSSANVQHPSSSRRPSGSGARGGAGRGRGGKTSKRARVDDSQDGGESDSGSDDDMPLGTGFATVSVPPPGGQGSLPSRL
ncbi:hypothetical protein BD310DRAFT_342599 [Dichomitus squalens]|uniref:Uncharacterized protein n=1 Tax=Dichomitus squalens TaxID=114155 RepID=A0A4Q9Q050_9APHY|nr:hypothetical protein BD310DRAFT_342599 [Dichomitus squalens]